MYEYNLFGDFEKLYVDVFSYVTQVTLRVESKGAKMSGQLFKSESIFDIPVFPELFKLTMFLLALKSTRINCTVSTLYFKLQTHRFPKGFTGVSCVGMRGYHHMVG